MTLVPTPTERELFDAVSKLGGDLWARSLELEGLNTDPKMFSVMLFKRLWSNHRGYAVLFNAGLPLESDIILRAGVEAAICIAANFRLQAQFVRLMRQDAASTLQGHIKLHRDAEDQEMVRACEESLREIQSELQPGEKPQRLNWKDLAERGGVPQLYTFHRMFSGTSSHVTGLSVLAGVRADDDGLRHGDVHLMPRRTHLMLMTTATLQGAMIHAGMIGEKGHLHTAMSLAQRLNSVSTIWSEPPG